MGSVAGGTARSGAFSMHPPTAAPASPALTPQHFEQINAACRSARSITRASGVATFSGWSMAAFALVSALPALFGSLGAIVPAAVLGGIAWNEIRGAGMLRRFDPAGPRRLAINQVVLAAFIVVYSLVQLYLSTTASPLEAYGGSTGDAQVDELVTSMTRTVSYGLYGSMAVLGILIPGLTAWYYHSRGPKLRRFAQANPAWVVEALRAAA